MRTRINSKAEFYALSRSLQLGNRLMQWTPSEFDHIYRNDFSSLPAIIGVRTAFIGGRSFRAPLRRAHRYMIDCVKKHGSGSLLLDEAADESLMTFQGEVMPDVNHLYMRCSTRACHQRALWESGLYEHVTGMRAHLMLRRYMDEDSYEDLHTMMRDYNDPIIEFACFSKPVGVLHRNTVFWECRTNY